MTELQPSSILRAVAVYTAVQPERRLSFCS
jgi:hypothetical protein